MALSNESFIVTTDTAGDIIVPVNEIVPYLNIQLIGYQFFGYHSVMSQNLANIVDDIKALQDGGLAQSTFDLNALVEEARIEINTQILDVERNIDDHIRDYTNQILEDTQVRLDEFDITINGDGVIPSMRDAIEVVTVAIGDETSGIIQRMTNIENSNDANNNLLTTYGDIVSDVSVTVTSQGNILTDLENTVNNTVTGVVPKVNTLISTVGDISSGIVQKLNKHEDILVGGVSYPGLLGVVGDASTGLIKDVAETNARIVVLGENLTPRTSTLENFVGITENGETNATGILAEITTLKNSSTQESSNSLVLVSRVDVLESFDIQAVINAVGDSSTGLVKDVIDNKTEYDNNKITTDSRITAAETTIVENTTKADANAARIVTETLRTDKLENLTDDHTIAINGMLTNVTDTLLTYDDGVTETVFTPYVLSQMNGTINVATSNNSDLTIRFESYFGSNSNPLPKIEIGKEALDLFIDDNGTNGLKPLINSEIEDFWLLEEPAILTDRSTVASNLLLLDKLQSDKTIVGSVDYKVDKLRDYVTTNATDIDTLNANNITTGSVDYKVFNAVEAHDALNQIKFDETDLLIQQNDEVMIAITDKITGRVTDVESDLEQEYPRYDTILPFLQKMFKYVNTPGAATNDDIDNIFNGIIQNLTINEVSIFKIVDNTITIDIKVPFGYVMSPIDNNILTEYCIIQKDGDPSYAVVVTDTTLDVDDATSTQIYTKHFVNELTNPITLKDDSTLNASPVDNIYFIYKTINALGHEAINKIPLIQG